MTNWPRRKTTAGLNDRQTPILIRAVKRSARRKDDAIRKIQGRNSEPGPGESRTTGPATLFDRYDERATSSYPEMPTTDELFSQLLEEQTDRLNPAMEIWYVKLLVRGVQIIVGQAKAHHHAGNLQHVLEISHNGN